MDFLSREALPLAGRIGLTFAPGKKDPGGQWDRDLGEDLRRLQDTYEASLLVSLIEDHEFNLLGIKDLPSEVRSAGMRFHRLAITDVSVPDGPDDVVALVRVVLAVAGAGDTVVLHCRGGLGRAGLVAGCCLVALGVEANEAIHEVRKARPGAIETRDQETFVRGFAKVWADARPAAPTASRFVGCLLGGALGDALGYPVEFLKTAAEIERVLGPVAPEHLPHARGKKAIVSDDTQMTLFTGEGLLRASQRSLDRGLCSTETVLLRAYHRWLSTQERSRSDAWRDPLQRGWLLDVPELHVRRAPGNTCLSALAATLETGKLPTVESRPNDSKGCGAVMRSAPIGLAAKDPEEAFRLARDAAVLTHGHPSGYLSAAYFAAVVHGVARGESLESAMTVADRLLRPEASAEEVIAAVRAARAAASEGWPSRETLEKLGGGWVGEEALSLALTCALAAERSPEHVAKALWTSVAHAGDSDSTGSLTGNLLGAMFGSEALPRTWLADLELREVIERLALDLYATFVLGLEPHLARYPAN